LVDQRRPGACQDDRGSRAGRLHGTAVVDRALGKTGTADGDLAAILTHQASSATGPQAGPQDHILAQVTAEWTDFGDRGVRQ